MKTRLLIFGLGLILTLTLAAPLARADEGMWLYNAFPIDRVQKQYGFSPTQEWLDHLRLSSVRFNNGGSGSFVSADGLAFTNHHVGADCIEKLATSGTDYMKTGFYAKTQADEAKCPDLELNVLVGIEDVTAKVKAASPSGMSTANAGQAQRSAMSAIEKDCSTSTGMRCDVVTLYSGEVYNLYKYKKYTDVRLVFAPEFAAAFFGGDPDNFTYPRYDLDMALFRVYDNGKPLHTDNYLKWSAKGAAPGELIFISGHPGSTSRQDTMAELLVERDVIEPAVTEYLKRRITAAQSYAAQGQEQARQVGTLIFGLQNSLKVYVGRTEALADKSLIAKKQAEEDDFRKKVAANPEWQKEYGGAWDTIAKAEEQVKPTVKSQVFRRTDSRLFAIAMLLVQYSAEIKKPDGERLPQFHDANLQSLKFQLLSPAPVTTATEKLYMTTALNLAKEKLGADDPYVHAVLNGGSVDETVNSLIDGTKLGDVAARKALMDGGEAAIAASTDPMIVAARRVDPIVRESQRKMRDTVESVLTPAGEKLGKARFLVYGKDAYPDATFTLRLSYGTVDGYPYNGTIAPPFTTFYGLYDRADSFSDKAPFNLTPKETAGLGKVDLSTPLDFVSTGDIIGGNSGSPVVNREGELVGLIFDGNIESLAGDFVYDGSKNRAVAVHSAGMIEGLRKLYGAGALADELEGKK